MKNTLLRLSTLLLLAGFALAGTPALAFNLSTAASGSTLTTTTTTEDNGYAKMEKKSHHKGFFSKVRNAINQKVMKAVMHLGDWASGNHNAGVAILLAFFLGGFGIHRVYLGGRPILILLYIITLGGIFGLLPLIDFIRLIIGQMSHYEDNDAFFAAFQ